MSDKPKHAGPIKLPLDTKDALRALLEVKPPPKPEKKAAKKKPQRKG